MIGNDIVDLKTISAKWQCHRFLNKVFTSEEQQHIKEARDKHLLVWRLWSMKEAAYKNYLQHYSTRFFNPKRITCQIINDAKGLATIDGVTSFTYSAKTNDYVHTIATFADDVPEIIKIYRTSRTDRQTQSAFIKDKLIKSISNKTGMMNDQLSIKKSPIGVPLIYFKSKPLNVAFSLSHCGRFGGYAIC
jgi:phosphopantetheine--protein transferase-like protein